jgi:hypothetical protein
LFHFFDTARLVNYVDGIDMTVAVCLHGITFPKRDTSQVFPSYIHSLKRYTANIIPVPISTRTDSMSKGSSCEAHQEWINLANSNFLLSSANIGPPNGAPVPVAGDVDFGRDGRRKRQPVSGRESPKKLDRESDGRNRNKASLRLGTAGKKSRNASLSSQRGSLRKRDRSSQREAKAEAAEQRRTVFLPEYVSRRMIFVLVLGFR